MRLYTFIVGIAIASLTMRAGSYERNWVKVPMLIGSLKAAKKDLTHIAASPNSDRLIATITNIGPITSMDGGNTWQPVGTPGTVKQVTTMVIFDPNNPLTYWLAGCYGPAVYRTTDGGLTFTRLGDATHAEGLAIDFTDQYRRTLAIALHERGREMMISTSSGLRWTHIGSNLPPGISQTGYMIIPEENTLVSGCSDGIYRSTDNGKYWTRVCPVRTAGIPITMKSGTIVWPAQGGGVLVSIDKTLTWTHRKGSDFATISEVSPGSLVGISGSQLHASSDVGITWRPIGPKLPARAYGFAYLRSHNTYFAWTFSTDTDLHCYRWRAD